MNTGMQDAFNLAWKLALVVHGKSDERLLDSYSAERSKVGDGVLKGAERLTAVATLRNPLAQSARNLVGHVIMGLSTVQHAVADTMTEVSIGYPDSPLNGPALRVGPRPGARLMPVAGQIPVGSGDVPRFALFAEPNAAINGLLEKFDGVLEPNVRPPVNEQGIWLARPDGYVACSSDDVEVIGNYLDGVLRPTVSITA